MPEPVQLDTIIVTAQKRAENVRDVPASISVLGDVQMEEFHITQLTDFAAYVPGFQVDSGGTPGQATLSLRGVITLGAGTSIGTYIDETPVGSSSLLTLASSQAVDLLPYDIQQIEVLRGPQGTLYGANTTGGLIKYVTYSPDLTNLQIRAGADVFDLASGDDLGWGSRFGINLPLVDGKLALRASYARQDTPGYIDNAVTGEIDQNPFSQQSGRIALLWQASEDLSLELSGMWQSIEADDNAVAVFDFPSLSPVGDGRSAINIIPQPIEKELAYYAATLKWSLGWADFVSATSYSNAPTFAIQDFSVLTGGIPPRSEFLADLDLEKWTQEFRLSSASGGRVEWLVGGFFTYEDNQNFEVISAELADGTPFPPGLIPGVSDPLALADLLSTYKEYAVFGHLTYKFSERFDLGLGARWARNEQEFTQISSGALVADGVFPGTSSENVWTYSLTPRFHLSQDSMLYGRVASSYRPGGPNIVITGEEPPQVDAETLTSYEIGLKTEFLDRRALIDVAAFYIDWKDIQLTATSAVGIVFQTNGGTAKSRGIELSSVFRPLAGLQLGFNAAYTDATLTEDAPLVAGLDGDRLPTIPEWGGALTADYNFPLRGDWTGHLGAGYRYVGERLSAPESNPTLLRVRSYTALDLNAGLSNDHWAVRLFVKNATDKHADLSSTQILALGQPVFVFAVPLQPRTVGLAVDVKF